ncbi:MAG: CotH kinase family protein [Flavobacteriales bacterium]|nr:CotH kinase family protein [Flavobacteriales bacterium]
MKKQVLYIVLLLTWALYAFKSDDTVSWLNQHSQLSFLRLHKGTIDMGEGLFEQKLSYTLGLNKAGTSIVSELISKPTANRWRAPGNVPIASITKSENGYNLSFQKSELPIVSLVFEEDALFGYTEGIYHKGIRELATNNYKLEWWMQQANYAQKGKAWERKVKLAFVDGTEVTDEKVAVRINGNTTRSYSQKTLRLIFPDIKSIEIDGKQVESKTWILRNAGNDWDKAYVRDMLTSRMVENMGMETQHGKPVVVYLNGVYWGIHYLRPKIDEYYLANKYGIAKEDVLMIESPRNVYRGGDKALTEFKKLVNFVLECRETNPACIAKIDSVMNFDDYFNYMAVQIFIANTDWPQNNWIIWKSADPKSKWNWILKDTDYGWAYSGKGASEVDMKYRVERISMLPALIAKSLKNDKEFKIRLYNSVLRVTENEFSEELVSVQLNRLKSNLDAEMENQINRWRTHISVQSWEAEIEEIRAFSKSRRIFIKENWK